VLDIKQLIEVRNIVIKGGDVITISGFTQVPNAILRRHDHGAHRFGLPFVRSACGP